jgi:hypothetical protein
MFPFDLFRYLCCYSSGAWSFGPTRCFLFVTQACFVYHHHGTAFGGIALAVGIYTGVNGYWFLEKRLERTEKARNIQLAELGGRIGLPHVHI